MNYPPHSSPPATTSPLAVASLVSGILAWCVLPFIGAIAAIICGHLARSEIRRSPVDRPTGGDGMAITGLVLGYAQLAAVLLAVLAFVALLFFGFTWFGWH
ncbi:putative transmembrane protein [Rhodanobacter fulvus Jip2]|uniref:Putative transmembrane protein n=1 Tax=Rhodanobacter fulvus Jip2 TaxID=1163408 RepID=I4VJ69_9GAMM|nr:DUF4190 domain-containing protein [Rhodanobacter fulvus]EIL87260.1 putative transmembrane protein [Rhodanobacter fulvus Jip2]